MPERHLARLSRSGRHQDAVMRNFIDTPSGCTENKCLSSATLKNHLLVQLPNPHRLSLCSGEKHAIKAAIGNRTSIKNRQTFRAFTWSDDVMHPVPGNAWTQLSKFIRRIPPCEQIEN